MNNNDDLLILTAVKHLIGQTYKFARDDGDAFERVKEHIKRMYEGKLKMTPNFLSLSDMKVFLKKEKDKNSEEVEQWFIKRTPKQKLIDRKIINKFLDDRNQREKFFITNEGRFVESQILNGQVQFVFSDRRVLDFELSKLSRSQCEKLKKYAERHQLLLNDSDSGGIELSKRVIQILKSWYFLSKTNIRAEEVVEELNRTQKNTIINNEAKVRELFNKKISAYREFTIRDVLIELCEVIDDEENVG